MAETLVIPCPHCDRLNRLPARRRSEAPKCGSCGRPLFDDRPLALTAARFERHAAPSEPPLLVDFWAAWCGPCRIVGPIVEELAGEYADKGVTVGKVDVDQNPRTASRFGIRSIPSILFFKNGTHVDTVVGAVPKVHLEKKIQEHL